MANKKTYKKVLTEKRNSKKHIEKTIRIYQNTLNPTFKQLKLL